MVHLLTFIILFCSLSVQRWSGIFFRETGVIAGSTNFSSNKRSLRYQSSKTSRVMELKHESITLSSLVRRALNPTCSILICFSPEGGGVLAPGFLRSLYRRVQGILRSLLTRLAPLAKRSTCSKSRFFTALSKITPGTTCKR